MSDVDERTQQLDYELGAEISADTPARLKALGDPLRQLLLDLVLERRPAAVMLSFGDPKPFVERIKRAGAFVVCQVQSIALAREAAVAGADILVAQGTEAGGHCGEVSTMVLVPEVIKAIKPIRDVPVPGPLQD